MDNPSVFEAFQLDVINPGGRNAAISNQEVKVTHGVAGKVLDEIFDWGELLIIEERNIAERSNNIVKAALHVVQACVNRVIEVVAVNRDGQAQHTIRDRLQVL